MAKKKFSRRRFFTDLLCLGGVLGGAAILGRPRPFFDQFLESQSERPVATNPVAPPPSPQPSPAEPPPAIATQAYPNDQHGLGPDPDIVVTTALQDSQRRQPDVTEAYPSDSDLHEYRTKPRQDQPRENAEALLPLWKRWA